MQQFIIHLENLLILLARRCRRTKRPVARVRRERRQNALVEAPAPILPKILCMN